MELILVLAGALVGFGISTILYRCHHVGNLRIDNSDPDYGPYMFLELEKGVGDISSKKHVILKVKKENYIPHK